MTEQKITIHNINGIRRVAEELLAFCDMDRCIIFTGEIGAGKTTLITALCDVLEMNDVASSPTFSIVNVYESSNHSVVYHMDLYRLNSIEEAFSIGIEEYLDTNNYCFIEWAGIIAPLLECLSTVEVTILIIDENTREFYFKK
jgi:tRNA threonylcarbamoyladenosine biosynthesis protein TsaE